MHTNFKIKCILKELFNRKSFDCQTDIIYKSTSFFNAIRTNYAIKGTLNRLKCFYRHVEAYPNKHYLLMLLRHFLLTFYGINPKVLIKISIKSKGCLTPYWCFLVFRTLYGFQAIKPNAHFIHKKQWKGIIIDEVQIKTNIEI